MAREVGHKGLTILHVVRSMHERKALMADLSDAFVAPPGGFGTLEEFCEVVTWTQFGLHAKPCGILNTLWPGGDRREDLYLPCTECLHFEGKIRHTSNGMG
jgi:hypothetical protein